MYTAITVIVFWDVVLHPSSDSHQSFGREPPSADFIVEEQC
jgi:hypothetical protein